jgi:MerR family transcriptional regulator/heat shock protein HspR
MTEPPKRARRTTVRAEIDEERGVFMISVAAELADMHPQTLRMYEARGLISPKRSPKNTRLYSQADVERLRRIQRMTSDEGLNLAGVETVLEMEARVERMRADLAKVRKRAAEMEKRMREELEALRAARGGELIPYGAYDSDIGGKDGGSVKVPITRRGGKSA